MALVVSGQTGKFYHVIVLPFSCSFLNYTAMQLVGMQLTFPRNTAAKQKWCACRKWGGGG